MRVEFKEYSIVVMREDSPKVYKNSTLMTWIKRELQKQGYDVIMKDLSKEPGNLLSTPCYGIIARDRTYQIYDSNYCIKNSYSEYNKGKIVLSVSR